MCFFFILSASYLLLFLLRHLTFFTWITCHLVLKKTIKPKLIWIFINTTFWLIFLLHSKRQRKYVFYKRCEIDFPSCICNNISSHSVFHTWVDFWPQAVSYDAPDAHDNLYKQIVPQQLLVNILAWTTLTWRNNYVLLLCLCQEGIKWHSIYTFK